MAKDAGGGMLAAGAIQDRVRELRRVPAGELRRNVKNWRKHPPGQRSALGHMLKEIGFVGAVIAREVDGQLELLDGHLRAEEAADTPIPVLIVDLNDAEADKVLATFDPLGGMAVTDVEALASLIKAVELDDNAELRKLLTDMQADLEIEEEEDETPAEVPGMALQPHEHYDYLVVLASTTHEWNSLCDLLELKTVQRRKRIGICRAIRANKLIALLRKDS